MHRPPILAVLALISLAGFAVSVPLSAAPTLPLPPRPANARTGAQLESYLAPMSQPDREKAIYDEIVKGNVPDFIRALVPIAVTASINGADHSATYYVTPDYMALGSNDDYFLMPMTPTLAQRVADLLGCNLPTPKMVNDISVAAAVHLTPSPIPPSSAMTTIPVFWDHNLIVRGQRQAVIGDHPLGALVDGDKKDVVVTARLATAPGKVAIYGWHYPDGTYIQPLYLGHIDTWADYSHGIRLVKLAMSVDGSTTTVPAVLADPDLSPLLSDEGAFTSYRYPVPTAPSGDLAENGDFESGFSNGVGAGWTKWEAAGSATITFGQASVNKHDGSYSQYWSRNDTTPFDGGLYQRLAVKTGQKYRIEAWMKRQSTMAGTLLRFGYDPTGGTNGTASSVVYADLVSSGPNDTWVKYAATVRATGDTLTLFARAGHTGTTGGTKAYFYLDGVSVVADDSGSSFSAH